MEPNPQVPPSPASRLWKLRDETTVLKVVKRVPKTKTQRRPAATKQAAARKRRAAHGEQEIHEVLRQVAVYAGFPNAWSAPAMMKVALERFDETDQESKS